MISRTKGQTWESSFRSWARGHMTPHWWPWRTFWSGRDFRTATALLRSPLARARCVCAQLCVSVSRSKADMSSGEETLEIGYCITGAIYLFWGLTYLIPPLNPVGVNSLAFQMCNAEGVRASSLFWNTFGVFKYNLFVQLCNWLSSLLFSTFLPFVQPSETEEQSENAGWILPN